MLENLLSIFTIKARSERSDLNRDKYVHKNVKLPSFAKVSSDLLCQMLSKFYGLDKTKEVYITVQNIIFR